MDRVRTLLVRLGLLRRNKWEPPTLLDSLLGSPLVYFAGLLFHLILLLRGRPAGPSRSKPPIRVVCISDTHEQTVPVPDGDLLVHAGDLTSTGSVAAIQTQIDWLDKLPHEKKILVCGNHDSWFDPAARLQEDKDAGRSVDLKSIKFLHHDSLMLEFAGGRRLKIYGAADIPQCGGPDNAFQYKPENPPWAHTIPKDTDILVTHTPPFGHLDLSLGCPSLLREIWAVKPRLHIFGHVHWGHGQEAIYWDDCQRSYESLLARPRHGPIWDFIPNRGWLDVLSMLYHGIGSILWRWLMLGSSGDFGGVMVNAAQMYGNTGKVKARPEIVLL